MLSRSNTETEAKSMALRLIIHFMGDIHQPLHDSNMFSKEFPKGDKGGNTILMKNHYTVKNLHSLWDTVLYKYHKTIYRPFTAESFDDFGKLATELRTKVEGSLTKSEIETIDFKLMEQESFDAGPQLYDGVVNDKDTPLVDGYVDKWMDLAEKRVVLAAYRLAYLIE